MNQKKVLWTVLITECDAIYKGRMRGACVKLCLSKEEQEDFIAAGSNIVAYETYDNCNDACARAISFNTAEKAEHGYSGLHYFNDDGEIWEQCLSNGLNIKKKPMHDFDEIRLYRLPADELHVDGTPILILNGSSYCSLNRSEYDNNLSDDQKKVVDEMIEQYYSLDDAMDEWIMSGPDSDDDDYYF